MKKYMHAGAMAILMFIVAAISVACDSKDEPETSASANFVSLKWDSPNGSYREPDLEDFHKGIRTVKAIYSAETGLLELTYKYAEQLAFDGYRGLMLAERDDLSVGFSTPDVTAGGLYPDCQHKVSLTWVIKINKPGKYSVGIYDLGINSVWFASEQFKRGRRLATVELDLGSDFNKTFKLEGYL